jgi:hypothetical protein
MIRSYYEARGLDRNGFVTEPKQRELEITMPASGQLKTQNSKLETAKRQEE